MKPEYLAIGATLSGVLISKVLDSIGFFAKQNVEQKKIVRETLFCLMELRHILKLFLDCDEKRFLEIYLDKYKKKFPDHILAEQEGAIYKFLSDLFAKEFKIITETIHNPNNITLSQWYSNSIRRLSSIYPVLAYEISNNKDIFILFDTQESLLKDALGNVDSNFDASYRQVLKHFRKIVDKRLAGDIRRIAFKAGIWNGIRIFIKTHNSINDAARREESLKMEIDAYLDNVVILLKK